jgi:uncharacterized membrane protein
MKKALFALAVLAWFAAATAIQPLSSVKQAVNNLCVDAKSLLPVVAMLMVVVAGVIYAAGQIMGAETRARANVWATAALTGALIGVLIYAIAPSVLTAIYNNGSGEEYVDIASACV